MKKNRAFIGYLLAVFLMIGLSACSNNGNKQFVAPDGTKIDLQEVEVPKPLRGVTVMLEVSGLGSESSTTISDAVAYAGGKKRMANGYLKDDSVYLVKITKMPSSVWIPENATVHYVFMYEGPAFSTLVRMNDKDYNDGASVGSVSYPASDREREAFNDLINL